MIAYLPASLVASKKTFYRLLMSIGTTLEVPAVCFLVQALHTSSQVPAKKASSPFGSHRFPQMAHGSLVMQLLCFSSICHVIIISAPDASNAPLTLPTAAARCVVVKNVYCLIPGPWSSESSFQRITLPRGAMLVDGRQRGDK